MSVEAHAVEHEGCEVVGFAEIAAKTGVNLETLRTMRRQGRFPVQPIGVVSGNPAYCLEEAAEWLTGEGKPKPRTNLGLTAAIIELLHSEPDRPWHYKEVHERLVEDGWEFTGRKNPPAQDVNSVMSQHTGVRSSQLTRVGPGLYQASEKEA